MTIDLNPSFLLASDGHLELWLQDTNEGCIWSVFIADTEIEMHCTNNAYNALALHEYITAPA